MQHQAALRRLTESAEGKGAAPPLRVVVAIALWAFFLAIAIPAVTSWARSRDSAAAVQTFVLHVECRRPTKDERVVILVDELDGRQVGECVYVTTRGAYPKKAPR